MLRIFPLVSLLSLFFFVVTASVRTRKVSFNDCNDYHELLEAEELQTEEGIFELETDDNPQPPPTHQSLIQLIHAKGFDHEMLFDKVRAANLISDSTSVPTDSMITGFFVENFMIQDIAALHEAFVVDEHVLDSLMRGMDSLKAELSARNAFISSNNLLRLELRKLFAAFPALVSETALRLMASRLTSFAKLLLFVADLEIGSFVDALPVIREAINDDHSFMDLLWDCINFYNCKPADTVPKDKRDAERLKLAARLEPVIDEFNHCLFQEHNKDVMMDELRSRFNTSRMDSFLKMFIARIAIQRGLVELVDALIRVKAFYRWDAFYDGIVCGNALMCVNRSAEMLQKLLDYGVNVEQRILLGSRRKPISTVSFLFLQQDPGMNEILSRLSLSEAACVAVAQDSVRLCNPALGELAIAQCPKAKEVIEREEAKLVPKSTSSQDPRRPSAAQARRMESAAAAEEEEFEESGYSHHGTGVGLPSKQLVTIWLENRNHPAFVGFFKQLGDKAAVPMTNEAVFQALIQSGDSEALKETAKYPFEDVDCIDALLQCLNVHGHSRLLSVIQAEPRILLSDIFPALSLSPGSLFQVLLVYPPLAFKHAAESLRRDNPYFSDPLNLIRVLLNFIFTWNPDVQQRFNCSDDELTNEQIVQVVSDLIVQLVNESSDRNAAVALIAQNYAGWPQHFKNGLEVAAGKAGCQFLF